MFFTCIFLSVIYRIIVIRFYVSVYSCFVCCCRFLTQGLSSLKSHTGVIISLCTRGKKKKKQVQKNENTKCASASICGCVLSLMHGCAFIGRHWLCPWRVLHSALSPASFITGFWSDYHVVLCLLVECTMSWVWFQRLNQWSLHSLIEADFSYQKWACAIT